MSPVLWPCAMPGPTARCAICSIERDCRLRRSEPTNGRGSPGSESAPEFSFETSCASISAQGFVISHAYVIHDPQSICPHRFAGLFLDLYPLTRNGLRRMDSPS